MNIGFHSLVVTKYNVLHEIVAREKALRLADGAAKSRGDSEGEKKEE